MTDKNNPPAFPQDVLDKITANIMTQSDEAFTKCIIEGGAILTEICDGSLKVSHITNDAMLSVREEL